MSALPQVEPLAAAMSPEPTQLDAFRSAMNGAGAALGANPEAIGQTLLSGLNDFSARESHFRATVQHVVVGDSTALDTPADASGELAPDAGVAAHGLTAAQALQKGEALQRQSMGVMMQTYSFALEATLVTNAATTFTSSINTLIKTQ